MTPVMPRSLDRRRSPGFPACAESAWKMIGAWGLGLLRWCRDRRANIAPAVARDRRGRGGTHRRSKRRPDRCLGGGFPVRRRPRRSGGFLHATAARGEQRPFGYYRITRLADGLAIGGIGFKGQPEDGCVEIGYGLARSARGRGYAAEAVVALLAIAASHELSRVIADTTLDNVASQRTLIRAGFRLVGSDGEINHYEALLDGVGRPA